MSPDPEPHPQSLEATIEDAMQLMTAVNMHINRLGRRLRDDGEQAVTRQLEETVAQSITRLRGALLQLSRAEPSSV